MPDTEQEIAAADSPRFTYPRPRSERELYILNGVFVFNRDDENSHLGSKRTHFPITHAASQEFVDAIYDEIHAGYGFTPLLGAGFSVSAGIPIIQQLKPYLQRCICIALGVEDDDVKSPDMRQLWNPRTDRWPPLIDRRRGGTRDWLSLMQAKIDSEKRDTRDPWIYLEALGAMAEWRSALFFLSRLVFDRPRRRTAEGPDGYRGHELKPRLVQPSQSVIDAGWREWLRDKRPSHNHKILASLSGLLRIDVIMSTNFDDLLERAFEASKNPLQVFDVHLMDGLPELSVVSRSRSLVKMHGGSRSLRADYSLDAEPSEEDKGLFAEYLAGHTLDRKHDGTPNDRLLETKKHLLVLGVGATEARTMAFLTNALRVVPDLKIFWACYTDRDVAAVIEYAKTLGSQQKRGPQGRARLYVVRHTDAGLLMLHIYQAIRKTLPPANAIYPSTTQLSLPPLPSRSSRLTTAGTMERADFKARLKSQIKRNALAIATAQDLVPGVTTVCAEVFRELELEYICMWIEMNDIYNIDELFEIIQEMAYYKLGQRDWTPLYAAGDHRPRRLEIERLADASSKPYLIFINAREKPGANRDFEAGSDNTWLDERSHWEELERLLQDLNDARSADPADSKTPRFTVILLCRDSKSSLVTRPRRFVGNIVQLKGKPNDDPKDVIDSIMEWIQFTDYPGVNAIQTTSVSKSKLHFLHTLVLMQRARHMAVVWSRCSGQPENRYWSDDYDPLKLRWLQELEERGLVRRKDGGFIWMHSNLREGLRERFLEKHELRLGCEERASIQQSIALWYLKLFDSTGTPPAIFEAVDHLCFSAAHLIVGAVKKELNNDPRGLIDTAKRRVDTARQLLQDHDFLIHSQGYPRASTRRLEYISSFWLNEQWMTLSIDRKKHRIWDLLWGLKNNVHGTANPALEEGVESLQLAIAKLQCVTVEISLFIAREIGEDNRAYASLQILSLRLGPPMKLTNSQLLDWAKKTRLGNNDPSQTDGLISTEEWAATSHDGEAGRMIPPTKSCGDRVLKFLQERDPKLLSARPVEIRRWLSVGDWIKWWFQCGLLGIASRSYLEAERSLYRALNIAHEMKLEAVELSELSTQSWMELIPKLNFNFGLRSDRRSSDSYKIYLPAIYSIQEASHLFVLQADADSRYTALQYSTATAKGEKLHPDGARQSPDYLKIAETLALRGLILIEQIQDSGVDRPDHDQQLMGHKSRLLQLAGLACRYEPQRKRSSRHAMSLMGDATAALNEAIPLFAHADYAVIDLRRAEVRLGECSRIKLYEEYPFEMWIYDRMSGPSIHAPLNENKHPGGPGGGPAKTQIAIARQLKEDWSKQGETPKGILRLSRLDRLRNKLNTDLAEASVREIHIDLRNAELRKINKEPQANNYPEDEAENRHHVSRLKQLMAATEQKIDSQEDKLLEPVPPNLGSKLREITSRATDALRFLDRAEPLLRERRRNVAWTTSYFELRLRAISFLLWAGLVQQDTPIPYLGLEAAMRRTETEPDQLLNDAVRMIRVDSYRLALVVLAYASCARALEIRLALDQSAVRLPERLTQMRDNLDHAVRQLEEVVGRRNGAEAVPKSDVNFMVANVVNAVLEKVKNILISLDVSIEEQTTKPKSRP